MMNKIKYIIPVFLFLFIALVNLNTVDAQVSCMTGADCDQSLVGLCTAGNNFNDYTFGGCNADEINDGGGMCHTEYVCNYTVVQGQTVSGVACNNNKCEYQTLGGFCQNEWPTPSNAYARSGSYTCGSPSSSVPGCSGSGCTPTPPNFDLSVSPATRSIYNGDTTSYTITVTPINNGALGYYNFAYPIIGCPNGAACTYVGGNTGEMTYDTTTGGVEYAVPFYKQVVVVATSSIPSTNTLNFTVTHQNSIGTKAVDATLYINPNPTPTVDIKGWGNTVPQGSPVDGPISMNLNQSGGLVWTSTNATNCIISRDGSSLGNFAVNSSAGVGPLTSTQTHSITCTGPGGTSNTDSVTHNIAGAPTVDIKGWGNTVPSNAPVDGPISMNYNTSGGLVWTSTNATNCIISRDGSSLGNFAVNSSAGVGPLTSSQTHSITCTGPSGTSNTDSVTHNVPISVSISANPASMTLPTNSTVLTWTTTGNPTSCTASNFWSGSKSASGGSETRTGMTAGTYVFDITCSKAGLANATDSVSVSVSNTPTGTLTGRVFADLNGNSSREAGEPYIRTSATSCGETEIQLSGASIDYTGTTNGTVSGSAPLSTCSSGPLYSVNLPPGTYSVGLSGLPLGWTIASPNPASGISVSSGGSTPKWFIVYAPNLTAGPVTPITTTANTPLTFSSTISNNGTGATGASFLNFFQVATGPGGTGTVTDLAPTSMNALAVSGANTATSPSYTFGSAGTYYVRACADKSDSGSAGTVGELDENNNCGSWTTVNVSPVVATSCTTGTAFVTSKVLGGPLRNNHDGWVGTKITIGATAQTVHALGRIRVASNTGSHTVKIVTSGGVDVPNGSITIDMSSGVADQYKYASLATPVTLSANTSYYVVSREFNGGDQWYDTVGTQINPSSVGTVPTSAWATTVGSYNDTGMANTSYVPVDLCLSNYTPPAAVTPVIDFSINPVSNTYPGGTTATWSVANNPTSCTADDGGTPTTWTGSKGFSGTISEPITGFPTVYTTYTLSLTCSNSAGSDTEARLFNLNAPVVNSYTVNVVKAGQGTVTSAPAGIDCGSDCSGSYPEGSTVTLTATPATARHIFTGWGGLCTGTPRTDNTCEVTVPVSGGTVYAYFAVNPNYREF